MLFEGRARTGYVAAVIGALSGVLIAMALAYVSVIAYVSAARAQYFHGGEAVLLILLGIPGIWFGATVGCWLALRLRHHTGARLTVFRMVWLVPLVVLLPSALLSQFDVLGAAYLVYPVIGVVVAALLASFPESRL